MPSSTNPLMKTPTKSTRRSENTDPNISSPITPSKSSVKPKRSNISKVKSPPPPPPQIQNHRKFILAKKKKNSKNGENGTDFDANKRREAAYEALRASHEHFFKKEGTKRDSATGDNNNNSCDVENGRKNEGSECDSEEEEEKKMNEMDEVKNLVMEEALNSVPEPGSGRVKHLVKAFETLLSIGDDNNSNEGKRTAENKNRVMNWALPGLQESIMKGDSSYNFSFPEFERDSRLCSSLDGGDRLSSGSRTSSGGRPSRRNSSDSLRSSWAKKLKVTSQHPFKLRTEQRGRQKEEMFLKKVKEMIAEEERRRIPIAQGLPLTTDEPECLMKPPVKERTEPVDVVLRSDVRAVERSEFDHYVAERLSFIEQIKQEKERLQKLEEEEEIRRLRRELVPKAQPMPYFDRPFVPKKSSRPRTVPKEPKFHPRPTKSSCVSSMVSR